MEGIDPNAERYRRGLARIEKLRAARANKDAIRKFVHYLEASGTKPATIWKYIYSYEKLLGAFGRNVDIFRASREQVVEAVGRIESMANINAATKAKIKICLKRMAKYLIGENEYYPRPFSWIKTTVKNESVLTDSDLLTYDETDRLMAAAHNIRDKALISLMCEAPLRPHEILAMRRKHLNLDAEPPYIIVPAETKTGMRRISVYESVQLLAQYANTFKELQPDDPLWMYDVWNGERRPMTYEALRKMIQKTAQKAKITKHVYPYLLRHLAISRLAPRVSNAILEKTAGWVYGSNQHVRYQHLSQSEVDRELAKAHGVELSPRPERQRFRTCPRCKLSGLSLDMLYCSRCGSALDIATAMKQQEMEQRLRGPATEAYGDYGKTEEMARRVFERRRKKS